MQTLRCYRLHDETSQTTASPDTLWLWLQMQEGKEQLAEGPRRAHAGIMSAATAIWKDLRAHKILPAMLDVSDDSSEEDSDNEQYDIAPGQCVNSF